MANITKEQIDKVGELLNNPSRPLKERFRALFTLKNIGGELSIEWISKAFGDESALLKHEVAYCLGQLQDPRAIPVLTRVLEDAAREPIVRHEAAEALAAVGGEGVAETLTKYSQDPVTEVRRALYNEYPLLPPSISILYPCISRCGRRASWPWT